MIGALNQRGTLASPGAEIGEGGTLSQSWTDYAAAWLRCEAGTGRDPYGPDRNESITRYRLTLRRNPQIKPGHRVSISGRHFLIRSIADPGPPATFIHLHCETMP